MTVRNVRAYAARGLLTPPRLVGRTGYYDSEHVEQLSLVRDLLAEGLTLSAVERVLAADTRSERPWRWRCCARSVTRGARRPRRNWTRWRSPLAGRRAAGPGTARAAGEQRGRRAPAGRPGAAAAAGVVESGAAGHRARACRRSGGGGAPAGDRTRARRRQGLRRPHRHRRCGGTSSSVGCPRRSGRTCARRSPLSCPSPARRCWPASGRPCASGSTRWSRRSFPASRRVQPVDE